MAEERVNLNEALRVANGIFSAMNAFRRLHEVIDAAQKAEQLENEARRRSDELIAANTKLAEKLNVAHAAVADAEQRALAAKREADQQIADANINVTHRLEALTDDRDRKIAAMDARVSQAATSTNETVAKEHARAATAKKDTEAFLVSLKSEEHQLRERVEALRSELKGLVSRVGTLVG